MGQGVGYHFHLSNFLRPAPIYMIYSVNFFHLNTHATYSCNLLM